MAGELYRAMQRTGGLQPVVDMMTKIQAEREKKKFLDNLFSSYNNATSQLAGMNNINIGSQSPIGAVMPAQNPQRSEVPNQENFSQFDNAINQVMGRRNNNGEFLTEESLPQSQDPINQQLEQGSVLPEQQQVRKEPLAAGNQPFLNHFLSNAKQGEKKDNYLDARNLLNQFVVNNLRESQNDPQKLNALTQLLSGQVEGMKPTPVEYETINPTMDIYQRNGDNLELWKEGEKQPGKTTSDNKYFGDGSAWIKTEDGMKFTPGPESTGGGNSELKSPPKISKAIGELTELADRYDNIQDQYKNKVDEDSYEITDPEDPTEKIKVGGKFFEEEARKLMPSIKNQRSAILQETSIIPGFNKSYNVMVTELKPKAAEIGAKTENGNYKYTRAERKQKMQEAINKQVESAREPNGDPLDSDAKRIYRTLLYTTYIF